MTLTRRSALETCRALWKWLEIHPGENKSAWPGWESNGGKTPKQHLFCPCCEYVWQTGHYTGAKLCVSFCPLGSLWPMGCGSDGSPYLHWAHGISPAENARIIWKAADAEIKKLVRRRQKKKAKPEAPPWYTGRGEAA